MFFKQTFIFYFIRLFALWSQNTTKLLDCMVQVLSGEGRSVSDRFSEYNGYHLLLSLLTFSIQNTRTIAIDSEDDVATLIPRKVGTVFKM